MRFLQLAIFACVLYLFHSLPIKLNSFILNFHENENYLREHSLLKPYVGKSSGVYYWEFFGSTVGSHKYIRLTPDLPKRKGSIWNKMV